MWSCEKRRRAFLGATQITDWTALDTLKVCVGVLLGVVVAVSVVVPVRVRLAVAPVRESSRPAEAPSVDNARNTLWEKSTQIPSAEAHWR